MISLLSMVSKNNLGFHSPGTLESDGAPQGGRYEVTFTRPFLL